MELRQRFGGVLILGGGVSLLVFFASLYTPDKDYNYLAFFLGVGLLWIGLPMRFSRRRGGPAPRAGREEAPPASAPVYPPEQGAPTPSPTFGKGARPQRLPPPRPGSPSAPLRGQAGQAPRPGGQLPFGGTGDSLSGMGQAPRPARPGLFAGLLKRPPARPEPGQTPAAPLPAAPPPVPVKKAGPLSSLLRGPTRKPPAPGAPGGRGAPPPAATPPAPQPKGRGLFGPRKK